MSVINTIIEEMFHIGIHQPKHLVFGKIYVKHWWLVETNQLLEAIGATLMARKGTLGKNKNDFQSVEFVNIPVPVAEKDAAKLWCADCVEHFTQIIPEFLADGYKFSVRWDENNETNIVAMTCVAKGHPNEGKCLASRSEDWLEAFALCLYKTRVLCPSGSWPTENEVNTWG